MSTITETPTTADVVAAMLAENTGSHFLDSGGAYGRNWERNQGRDFGAEPAVSWGGWGTGEDAEVWPTISLYHFLVDRLEYDHELTMRLDEEVIANSDESYLADAVTFAEMLHEGEPYNPVRVHNSYNWESSLSQVIQWAEFTYSKPDEDGDPGYEERYVVLSVHGGCDVRGGYTRPRVFKMEGEYALCMEDISAGHMASPVVDIQLGIDGTEHEVHEVECPLGMYSINYRTGETNVYVHGANGDWRSDLDLYGADVEPYLPTRNEDGEVVCKGCGQPMWADLDEYSY